MFASLRPIPATVLPLIVGWLMVQSVAPTVAAPALAAPVVTDRSTPRFTPCRLEHPLGLAGVQAECTQLAVPESDAPNARRLSIAIARIPAVNRQKAADPLFLIAGGPGMGTQSMFATVAPVFWRVNRDRDLVLVDQRGTGNSSALECPEADDELESDPGQLESLVRACLASLQKDHDLAQYTTSRAVRDLDAVREALGYAQINLYGISYGTRVAQHYLRRHPEHTRSVILDGVVQPDRPLGPDIALDAEGALQRIFARCRDDGACRAAFGNPLQDYRTLRARLEKASHRLTLPDPRSNMPTSLEFGVPQLRVALRLSSYSAAQASLLPLALHRAAQADDYTALASLFTLSVRSLEHEVAAGMHYSVICAEDVPFAHLTPADRARLESTYLGAGNFDALTRICAVWPRGSVDANFHEPVHSNVPVLLLSGSNDPVTPPSNAVGAMRFLTRARHVMLAGEGHGQLGVRCMDRVFEDFLRDANPSKLNVTCLDQRMLPPFFTSTYGPAP